MGEKGVATIDPQEDVSVMTTGNILATSQIYLPSLFDIINILGHMNGIENEIIVQIIGAFLEFNNDVAFVPLVLELE